MIVHGHLRREHKEKTGDVRRSEFRSSDVYRRIELPAPIDAGHVKATLKQGMLTVVAAKAALEVPKKVPSRSRSQRELGVEAIDVLLLGLEDVVEELTAHVVRDLLAMGEVV